MAAVSAGRMVARHNLAAAARRVTKDAAPCMSPGMPAVQSLRVPLLVAGARRPHQAAAAAPVPSAFSSQTAGCMQRPSPPCSAAHLPAALSRQLLLPSSSSPRLACERRMMAGESRRSMAAASNAAAADDSSSAAAPPGSNEQLPSVGFLGLGIMGSAMAGNLIRAGFEVTVWNRSLEKCRPLQDMGAKTGATAADVAAACDVTFAMLADPEAALLVACGPKGAVEGLSSGKGYVDVSTVDAHTSRTIAAAVKGKGALFLEAPVSGSKKPAEDGTLIFLTAGDKELFDRVEKQLDVMGKCSFYLGEVGNAAAMKLVVNMVMGSMMAAFSEGLVLGDQAGLDRKQILEVISQGAINSPMFSMKGPSMILGTYPPAFPLKHQQKDLRLAIALADEKAVSLPLAAAANEMYKKARGEGLGDNDFSAVHEVFKVTKE